ncbi:hypothetical protein RF55_12443 [Lasius niger]|uniref:Reverse transcriptase domain-containing protein n=1 Tax=Lasius niger TaxID=67767 RepID=A0A0J7KD64_LASNI|nr:hypothetical protein RF55_12443 [Lasius niger]
MPMIKISENQLDIPSNIALADPSYGIPGKIDVLLGASIFWELMCNRQIRRMKNSPVFQETLLGWIISGSIYTNNRKQREEAYCGISINNELHKQLEKFWEIEEVELPVHRSDEEIQCEEHFVSTHSRSKDGRFVVQLPLKKNREKLGESFDIAEKRLKALERKLERQPELKEHYHEFIMEYLKLGHMTEIQPDERHAKPAYYIPHHAVVKEESTTTRVRVVFDASCKTSSGKSLNDILMVGPTIQENLMDIIIRLRQYKYAMAADIAKMYRQVKLKKEDRKLQRILWRWDRKKPIQIFELNTITYGMASSPFLAIRCLQEAAQQMEYKYKDASEVIRRDFYVDDLLTGADTVKALIQLKQEITCILDSSKFELRKWISNVPEIGDQMGNREKEVTLSESIKILGLWWNPTADNFQYRIKINNNETKITKRNILARVAQVYDPLGLVGPIVVQIKILIQRLWQSKCTWDEEVTNDIKNMWIQWKSQILSVEELLIPRRIICDNPVEIELHGFCDASESAYGACIYLRSTNSRSEYTVRLLCAKSRVAPRYHYQKGIITKIGAMRSGAIS